MFRFMTAFLHDLDLFKHISRYLGLQTSYFYFIYIIRFVFSTAFQRRNSNCSTAKTREDTAKRKRKGENFGLAFLQYLDLVKHISRNLRLQTSDFQLIFFIRFVSISFPMPYSKLFYCKNSRRSGENNAKSGRRKKHSSFNDSLRFTGDHFPQAAFYDDVIVRRSRKSPAISLLTCEVIAKCRTAISSFLKI